MSTAPLPTKLILLADLGTFSAGAKVRFLGCVTSYCTRSAILKLEHNHPVNNAVTALVDVGLLLNSLASNETQIGEWVNVCGYVAMNQCPQTNHGGKLEISIQAIVLWTSKAFNLDEYERTLDRKD